MQPFRKIILLLVLFVASTQVKAQNETEALVQNLQTANFNNLLSFWDTQVEVSLPDIAGQRQVNAREANDLLRAFFNRKSIFGFEKSAARKVGNTLYLTGKLLSSNTKFNITLLLQESKNGYAIISLRVN